MRKQYRLVVFTICCLVVNLIVQNAFCQPVAEWDRSYGGSNGDYGKFGNQTRDHGYIIAGNTLSYGAGKFDIWLVKTDSSGTELWDKTFGGSEDDYCETAQTTEDGGLIIVGYTESFGAGGKDLWLIKTDSSGNTDWAKTYGGVDEDHGYSVQQTTDGGFIVTGTTTSYGAGTCDAWLIRTDSSGDTLWTKTFGEEKWDEGHFVQQTTDGGYIITGHTNSYGGINGGVWLIKTDAAGNEEWNKVLFRQGLLCTGRSVQQTTDGGYIIGAEIWDVSVVNKNMALIKADSKGDTTWMNIYGGYDEDSGYSAIQTSDGGYIITGTSGSFGGGGYDLWVVKTDSTGKNQWGLLGTWDGYDVGRSVVQLHDGDYLITGIKENPPGQSYDAWLVRISEGPTDVERSKTDIPSFSRLSQNYPNPFNPSTNIRFNLFKPGFVTLKIYDLLGNKIETLVNGHRQAGEHRVSWTANGLPSGLYFYRLQAADFLLTKKLILQK